MFKDVDLSELRRLPRVAYYFRYPLHHADFRVVRADGRVLGRYAAKPLYGRLAPQGAVDRTAGFNGQIAVIFLPARARSVRSARLLLTRIAREAGDSAKRAAELAADSRGRGTGDP
jgi:hypothetical protein